MVKLWMIVLGIAALGLFAVQTVRADDLPGAKLFETYCAACHGEAGKGGSSSSIGDEQYLSSHSDEAIVQIIRDGNPAKGMPAWSKTSGGKLTDDQIADIVTYLRSLSFSPAAAAAIVPASPSNPTPSEYAQTKMTVTQSFNANGQPVVNVKLLRIDDTPVIAAPIAFRRGTTFGDMDLGTVKTDALGVASLVLPEVPESARLVDISFKGDPKLGSSSGKIALRPPSASSFENANLGRVRLSIGDGPLLPPEGSWITPNPPLLPLFLILLVVLGVWSAYAYVISQVIGIWKTRPDTRRGYKPTSKAR